MKQSLLNVDPHTVLRLPVVQIRDNCKSPNEIKLQANNAVVKNPQRLLTDALQYDKEGKIKCYKNTVHHRKIHRPLGQESEEDSMSTWQQSCGNQSVFRVTVKNWLSIIDYKSVPLATHQQTTEWGQKSVGVSCLDPNVSICPAPPSVYHYLPPRIPSSCLCPGLQRYISLEISSRLF